MGVEGRDASLDLWMGTFTGREVADRKSVIRFLNMMSERMGRNSGPEDDKEDLREEPCEMEMAGEVVKEEVGEEAREKEKLLAHGSGSRR